MITCGEADLLVPVDNAWALLILVVAAQMRATGRQKLCAAVALVSKGTA